MNTEYRFYGFIEPYFGLTVRTIHDKLMKLRVYPFISKKYANSSRTGPRGLLNFVRNKLGSTAGASKYQCLHQ